jgi:hypothetical protein
MLLDTSGAVNTGLNKKPTGDMPIFSGVDGVENTSTLDVIGPGVNTPTCGAFLANFVSGVLFVAVFT